jgi:ribosomal protein L32
MKKRSRQYAGKALKDVTALNKCSACGNVKRAHLLCPYCVNGASFRIVAVAYADARTEIKQMFKDPLGGQGVIERSIKAKQLEHNEAQRRKKDAEKPVDGSE